MILFAIVYGLSMLGWIGCLVPLALFWRDVNRRPGPVIGATVKFLFTVLLFLVPLNLTILIVALTFELGQEMLSLASAGAAFAVTTLVYRRTRRRLAAAAGAPAAS